MTTPSPQAPRLKCQPHRRITWWLALLLTATTTHLSSASHSSSTKYQKLVQLRGGGFHSDDGGFSSSGNMNDEDLDEYIEFLLAAADNEVSESENPLFKKKTKRPPEAEEPARAILASTITTGDESMTEAAASSNDAELELETSAADDSVHVEIETVEIPSEPVVEETVVDEVPADEEVLQEGNDFLEQETKTEEK